MLFLLDIMCRYLGYFAEQRNADMARENQVCYWTFAGYGRRAGLCRGPRWFISQRMDAKAGKVGSFEFTFLVRFL